MISFIKDLFVDKTFGAERSPKWSDTRNEFLALNPVCAICGKKSTLLNKLNVHHILPFHINHELELDKINLITLCREHHLWFGHLGSWKSYNSNIVNDSLIWRNKILNRT